MEEELQHGGDHYTQHQGKIIIEVGLIEEGAFGMNRFFKERWCGGETLFQAIGCVRSVPTGFEGEEAGAQGMLGPCYTKFSNVKVKRWVEWEDEFVAVESRGGRAWQLHTGTTGTRAGALLGSEKGVGPCGCVGMVR